MLEGFWIKKKGVEGWEQEDGCKEREARCAGMGEWFWLTIRVKILIYIIRRKTNQGLLVDLNPEFGRLSGLQQDKLGLSKLLKLNQNTW